MAQLVADRFELVDRIGSGGVGTVWRAYDHERRRYCAAKLVRRQEPEALLRVLREQSLRLSHPNVLSPYAWAAEAELVLVASDLVHGGSLDGLIRDHGALPWRYAAEIVGQVLDGLAHVHAAGLVHRDVKPANVLLEATGQSTPHARLADFGIAYLTDGPRLTASGFVVGTPGYLAPEALAGHPPHPSQDLYAAGVLAWQLLTGAERPEPGDAAEVPAPLRTLVTTLLATNPANRPPDATTARRLLAPILAAEPLRLPAMSADGEPVEVFDVLGPNPPALTAAEEATEALKPSRPIPTADPTPEAGPTLPDEQMPTAGPTSTAEPILATEPPPAAGPTPAAGSPPAAGPTSAVQPHPVAGAPSVGSVSASGSAPEVMPAVGPVRAVQPPSVGLASVAGPMPAPGAIPDAGPHSAVQSNRAAESSTAGPASMAGSTSAPGTAPPTEPGQNPTPGSISRPATPHESPVRSNPPAKVVHTPREPGVLSPPADRMASGPPPGIGWGLQPVEGRESSGNRTPAGTFGSERPSPPAPTRRSPLRWWLAATGALLLAGGAALGFLVDDEVTPPPSQPTRTAPEPPTVGERCGWQDVAATEISQDGTPVRCVRQPDGSYLWEPA